MNRRSTDKKEEAPNLEQKRWKNRRGMAWVSLSGMLIVTLFLLFAPLNLERLKILSEPITWFYFAMTSIVGAYMGFTTWASKK